ncbi:DoxX family membrane protein [Deinococcus deserti]|uniref:Uncharacterized protein n=1 Tax=Deinococcus deserti (strain DSM 17065 / CIP 109153 / LMG 22923 / VCD115) TaxID=546414 RepID=C1CYY4_DEIDV|nr:DoxX family membrane protein [Deinococcus deserti]ACO47164.1 conserved hypothetical protein, precursor; putative membrane protein [Deinococcus deserti VCD115]
MISRLFLMFFLVMLSVVSTAAAHKSWFVDAKAYLPSWASFLQPLPLIVTALVILTTLGAAWLQSRRGGRGFLPGPAAFGAKEGPLSMLYGLLPLLLAVHVAVPLLINGMQTQLFSPNNNLPPSVLGLLQISIALALFYGLFTRIAAVVLAALWLIGLVLLGIQPMLENLHYLGIAAFFFLAGRGPVSVDRVLLPKSMPSPGMMNQAVNALRIGTGLSLIVVALTEKLANAPLATAFIQQYPLNFVSQVGIPLPDSLFLAGAGGTELLIGLFLVFNIFTREISALAWVFFNLTLTVFDTTELINHLPFYGVMVVLLMWMPGPATQVLWSRGLLGKSPLPADSQTP